MQRMPASVRKCRSASDRGPRQPATRSFSIQLKFIARAVSSVGGFTVEPPLDAARNLSDRHQGAYCQSFVGTAALFQQVVRVHHVAEVLHSPCCVLSLLAN